MQEDDFSTAVDTMLAPTAALDTNPDRDWALLMIKHNQVTRPNVHLLPKACMPHQMAAIPLPPLSSILRVSQAAIEMADSEEQYGTDQALRALAAEIVTEKTAEIKVFNTVLTEAYATPSSK